LLVQECRGVSLRGAAGMPEGPSDLVARRRWLFVPPRANEVDPSPDERVDHPLTCKANDFTLPAHAVISEPSS
jgi:hypothetical protein